MSVSQTNLNCFGSFDGIHKLILGKFRFGMALKRSKSICDNEMTLNNEDDIYLPNPVFLHNNLRAGIDFKAKRLRRTASHGDLALAVYSSSDEISSNEKKL